MKIYIVTGETGKYDDFTQWDVISYIDKKKAEEHAINATNEALSIYKQHKERIFSIPHGLNKYDLDMRIDNNGVIYFVRELELIFC